jgi:flavodoxin
MHVKIIFETQTGTTQYVAELIKKKLDAAGHSVTLHSLKYNGLQPDFSDTDVVVFGAPTYDDGYLEKTVREWIAQVSPDLSKLKVAVFGLGNRTYPQFCKAADLLEEWVQKNRGMLLVPTLRVDHFPDDTQPILAWADQMITALQ